MEEMIWAPRVFDNTNEEASRTAIPEMGDTRFRSHGSVKSGSVGVTHRLSCLQELEYGNGEVSRVVVPEMAGIRFRSHGCCAL